MGLEVVGRGRMARIDVRGAVRHRQDEQRLSAPGEQAPLEDAESVP
jgi:hypothetical protein